MDWKQIFFPGVWNQISLGFLCKLKKKKQTRKLSTEIDALIYSGEQGPLERFIYFRNVMFGDIFSWQVLEKNHIQYTYFESHMAHKVQIGIGRVIKNSFLKKIMKNISDPFCIICCIWTPQQIPISLQGRTVVCSEGNSVELQ